MEEKYPNNIPPDYYSDESESVDECDLNYDFEIVKFVKKHPGDIPDIGFRAGIKGNHFNIKLTTKMQKNFDDIAAIWNVNQLFLVSLTESGKKSPELLEKIITTLANSMNPFETTLQFFGNANEFPKIESLSFAVLEAMEQLKEKLKATEIEEYLDENTKHVAFHFIHDKNLTSIRKTIAIFELVKSQHIFINYINHMIDKREFKNAGQIACELQLFKEFGLDDLLIPLFLEDKMVIVENYLKNAPNLQVKTVMFLDSLLKPPSSVYEKCEVLLKKYFILNAKTTKFGEKSVNTLIDRLTTLYQLDSKAVAPLHSRYKLSKKLGFALRNHYEDKKSSTQALEDQLQQLSINSNLDLQVELLERLLLLYKFEEAKKYAEDFNVPKERYPEDLNDYIEGGTIRKRIKLMSPKTDTKLFNADDDKSREPTGDQQVPGTAGLGDEEKEDEDFYELKLDPSKILMIDSANSYHEMISDLITVKEIGLDTEHKLSGGLAILQIATRGRVYIVDILALQKILDEDSLKKIGCEVFNNKEILKIGFSLASDMQMLQMITSLSIDSPWTESYCDLKVLGTNLFKVIDFKYPHHEFKVENLGLSKLTKLCFGKGLDKRNQISNWSLRPLRPEQLVYAATDAFVLIEIRDLIDEKLKKMGIAENELEKYFYE